MGDDKKQDSANQPDDKEPSEAEGGEDTKQPSDGAAKAADDDIIIK